MTGVLSGRTPGSLVHEVVTEVAAREGIDPVDLDPPLQNAIETNALEALFADPVEGTTRENVSVEFTYRSHRVFVDGETVRVRDAVVRGPHVDELPDP